MPSYLVRIETDVCLDQRGLDTIEDAVYDVVTQKLGGSGDVDLDGVGVTDVHAVYN